MACIITVDAETASLSKPNPKVKTARPAASALPTYPGAEGIRKVNALSIEPSKALKKSTLAI